MQGKRALFPLALVSVGFALGWTASAWRFALPFFPHPGGPPPLPPSHVLAALGLGAEVKQRIETVAEEGRRRERELRLRLEGARLELETAVDGGSAVPQIREKYSAFLAARDTLDRNHFETMMQLHQLLTPEQIRELRSRRPPPPPRPE